MGMEADFEKLFTDGHNSKAGPGTMCRAFALVKSVDSEKRRIRAIASTGAVDRDGEIIDPEAFRKTLSVFMVNPVVLAAHMHRLPDGRSPVVANVTSAKVTPDGLDVEIDFHDVTDLGREYWALYRDKVQRALSVGFIPIKGEYSLADDGKRIFVHTEVELLEISCVPVPSNREALSRSAQGRVDFVDGKRQEREDEKLLAEIEREDLDGRKAAEFAELLMYGPAHGGEMTDAEIKAALREAYGDEDADNEIETEEADFAKLFL